MSFVVRGHAPPHESLKLRSSEVFIFAFSKFSGKATKLHEKGRFTRDFKKWGGGTFPLYICLYVCMYEYININIKI